MINLKGTGNSLKILVINLRGSLDSQSSNEFYEYVSSKLEEGYKKFIINCEGLISISSAGVSTIIKLKKKIAINDSYIVYSQLNSEIQSLLRFFGISKNIIIAKDREDAKNILDDPEYLKTGNTLQALNTSQNQYISIHGQNKEDKENESFDSFSESELDDIIDEYYAYGQEEDNDDRQESEDEIPESQIQAEPISMVERLDDTDDEIEPIAQTHTNGLDDSIGLTFTPEEINEKMENAWKTLEEELQEDNFQNNNEFSADELEDAIDEYYAYGQEEENFWDQEEEAVEIEEEDNSDEYEYEADGTSAKNETLTEPQYKLGDILNSYYAFLEDVEDENFQTSGKEERYSSLFDANELDEQEDYKEENFHKTHQFYDLDGRLNIGKKDDEEDSKIEKEPDIGFDEIISENTEIKEQSVDSKDDYLIVDVDNLEVESVTNAQIKTNNLLFSNEFHEYEQFIDKENNEDLQNAKPREKLTETDVYDNNDLDVQALLMKPITDGDTHQYENLNEGLVKDEASSNEESLLAEEEDLNNNLYQTPYELMYSANKNNEPETSQFKIITVPNESSLSDEDSISEIQNANENILDAIEEKDELYSESAQHNVGFDNFDEIITECFSCGTKLKVRNPGNHRCPACNHFFKMTQSGTTYNI